MHFVLRIANSGVELLLRPCTLFLSREVLSRNASLLAGREVLALMKRVVYLLTISLKLNITLTLLLTLPFKIPQILA